MVKLLLEKGADPNFDDEEGRTPLWWAAKNGYEAVVELLLEKDAGPSFEDEGGRTPLHRAAQNGHETVMKLLEGLTPRPPIPLKRPKIILHHNNATK